jgi:Predicted membrane protein (DUF2254)
VWHDFSFFTAVIVFALTAVFAIGSASQTTLLVPIVLGIATFAAIALLRSLQTAAFRSIQLASILEQVSQRGRVVIDGVHPEMPAASDRSGGPRKDRTSSVVELPSDGRDLLWPRHSSIVQTVDVPRLLRVAEHEGLASICAWSRARRSFTRVGWLSLSGVRIWPMARFSRRSGSGPSAPSIRILRSRCACLPISRCARCLRLSTTRPPLFKRRRDR